MLRSEPIVRDEGIGPSARCDVPDEVAVRLGRSPIEPTTVRMKDHGTLMGRGWPRPPAGDPSHGPSFKGDSLRDRDAFHHPVKWTSAGSPFDLSLHRCDHRPQSGRYDRVLPAKRMNLQPRGLRRLHFFSLSSLGGTIAVGWRSG